MSVDFCGIPLAHPVINGSGTFDAIAARTAFGEVRIGRSALPNSATASMLSRPWVVQ